MDYVVWLYGIYFWILGIWWMIQISKCYCYCKQKHLEFKTALTFPCCQSCHKFPVEATIRLVICISLVILSITTALQYRLSNRVTYFQYLQYTTIFTFYTIASIIDVVIKFKNFFMPNLDYITLALTFGVQASIFGISSTFMPEERGSIDTMLMLTSLVCCICTGLELGMRNSFYLPLLRCLCLMILGSWLVHSALILDSPVSVFEHANHDRVTILSMYFSWHCAINFAIILSLWLLSWKCYVGNKCPCLPVDLDKDSDMLYLENRVHFDYHVLDRFDSDLD